MSCTLCRGSWAQIHVHTYSWSSLQKQSLASGTKMASSQTEATRCKNVSNSAFEFYFVHGKFLLTTNTHRCRGAKLLHVLNFIFVHWDRKQYFRSGKNMFQAVLSYGLIESEAEAGLSVHAWPTWDDSHTLWEEVALLEVGGQWTTGPPGLFDCHSKINHVAEWLEHKVADCCKAYKT